CPEALVAVIEHQLYAQYPDCTIERVPEDILQPHVAEIASSVSLHLTPDLFPIKRYPQFEDALNRVTADPLTAILATLARDRKEQLRSTVEIIVRPATARRRRRAEKAVRRLARPFFRRHPRLAHA